jgi:carbon monoxide dehydrogenase subunit G
MEMTGRQRIEAPRETVWAALNDPEILKRCIPGCQSLEKIGDDRMKATAAVKIGPIGAKFAGEVMLSELDPPNGYRIDGEGTGGAAGFAKGGAKVRLSDDGPGATLLDYEVNAQVGGKLAQLGGALIDATAKQMAGQFFKKLATVIAEARFTAQPVVEATGATADAVQPVAAGPAAVAGPSSLTWGIAALCAGLIGFILGRQASGWESAGAWPGLAIGLTLVVVAGAGFAFGKASSR